jgi:hypothetical protein
MDDIVCLWGFLSFILKWWDWPEEKIFKNLEVLCSSDLDKVNSIK